MKTANANNLKAATRLPFCCKGLCAALFIFYATFSFPVQAQTQAQLDMQNAYRAYLEKRYFSAALLYKRSYDKQKDPELKDSAAFMVAESYRLANNMKLAFKWFETTVSTRYPNPEVLFLYGQALKNYERYEEAAKAFYDYNFEMGASASRGQKEMRACEQANKWKNLPSGYELKNLSSLNSESSDYCPFIINNRLYFSSARAAATGDMIFEWTGQKCSDIFYAETNAGGEWSRPEILSGPLNSPFNEGASCLDSSGNNLYYTQCNGSDGKGISCNILVSRMTGDVWSKGELLPFCSEDFSTGQPSLSTDGMKLFFSSDMPGGLGAHDIYFVEWDAVRKKWSAPVNAGPAINTAEDEMFPSISEDGVLYFSSKGHMGMGGFDIYSSRPENNSWSNAENLRYPVNSGGDDFNLVFVKGYRKLAAGETVAYLASNRLTSTGNSEGKGDDDIYEVKIKFTLLQLHINVRDKETGEVLPGSVLVIGGETTGLISDSTGMIKIKLNGREQNLISPAKGNVLNVERSGYYTGSMTLPDITPALIDSTIYHEVLLSLIPEKEKEIVLEGIFYDLDKYVLRDESKMILDSLIHILEQNPGIAVEIASHTDSRSDSAYNYILSQKRAQSCVDYLIERGINKGRLSAVGHGESRPVNDCRDGIPCTEEQHQENRRTSFRIISTTFKAE